MSISETDGVSIQSASGSYADLAELVKEAGLLERRGGLYFLRTAVTLGLLAGGWAAFFLIGDHWWQLIVAVFLAVMFNQIAFLGHDVGHRQMFVRRRANDAVGLVLGNLLIGLSYDWWTKKHNLHHAYPNQINRDPDVSAGVLSWTAGQASRRSAPGRLMARSQAFLFFPLLLLEGMNLHVSSVIGLKNQRGKARTIEAVLLGAHIVGYLVVVFWVLSPGKALAFIAVQQGLYGLYLGCSFAPNHKGMVMFDEDDRVEFFVRQAVTARNVRGGRFTAIALGSLNYQIEHHLFPTMPSMNLRRCQPLVRKYLQDHGVPYCEMGLFQSYRVALASLHQAGSGGRTLAAA